MSTFPCRSLGLFVAISLLDQVVDLSEVYDLSEPGRYEVTWGCENVATDLISIEIVE